METPRLQGEAGSAAAGDVDRRFLLGGLAGVAGIAAIGAAVKTASAGPLNPPGGSIASTGKPIGEIEPRIAVNSTNTPGVFQIIHNISAPGSYYLTGNINVGPSQTGVQLGQGVTLDLNGFSITGSGGGNVGVRAAGRCTVRNGSISGAATGIDVGSFGFSTKVTVEDVEVTGFADRGVRLGLGSVVRRCAVSGNGLTGIEVANNGALVEDCQVSNPAGTGIYLNSASTLRRCVTSQCVTGARVGESSLVESCVMHACTSNGLVAFSRSTVRGCSASATTGVGTGIDVGEGGSVTDCHVTGGVTGIRIGNGGVVAGCTIEGQSLAAVKCGGNGVLVEGCRIMGCFAGVDMSGPVNCYVHKCVMLATTNPIQVSGGGNWYPNVTLGGVNSATNPLASVLG